MPIIDSKKLDFVRATVKRNKIFMLNELVSLLDCSSRTVQVKLKLWKAYTSYNQNGKYYTLPETPHFDVNGLWRYKDIAFSKHGNLKQTIIHLVRVSSAGLSGRQLGDLLGLAPQSFMHHFSKGPGIRREKHEGIFVYFADEPEIYEMQRRQRQKSVCRSAVVAISEPEAVMILVAIISHHGISADDILAMPGIKKSKLTLPAIQGFMEHHGLVKKIPILKL
ncbi:MAG: hypothetical protein ABFR82_16975 [Nitrospirota bacterium]